MPLKVINISWVIFNILYIFFYISPKMIIKCMLCMYIIIIITFIFHFSSTCNSISTFGFCLCQQLNSNKTASIKQFYRGTCRCCCFFFFYYHCTQIVTIPTQCMSHKCICWYKKKQPSLYSDLLTNAQTKLFTHTHTHTCYYKLFSWVLSLSCKLNSIWSQKRE